MLQQGKVSSVNFRVNKKNIFKKYEGELNPRAEAHMRCGYSLFNESSI